VENKTPGILALASVFIYQYNEQHDFENFSCC